MEKIIRKVKGLLALAEDNSNMKESQSAFLTAQKMMVKYGIDPREVENKQIREVLIQSASEYKKLWWWERMLGGVIADNFRCDWYYNRKHLNGSKQMKSRIMFVGYEQDVHLATEMYLLVIEATLFYAQRFIKQNNIQGDRGYTIRAKDDYIRGFVDGLEKKFQEQVSDQEWGLVVVVPQEVTDKKEEIVKGGKVLKYQIPYAQTDKYYQQGYKEGNTIDYTKSTIGEEIIQ